jgi:hypothetical protein
MDSLPESAATSEEVRALITVMYSVAEKLDRISDRIDRLLGPCSTDPRYKPNPFRP